MKERLKLATNVGLFLVATMLLGSLQTSFWFQIFGYFPSPAFWLPCLIYVAMFRSTLETVLYSYLTAFILGPMTVMPEGILLISCLAIALSAQLFKKRIFWTASSYFMMVCGLGALVFHIYQMMATFVIGDTPLTHPQVIDWIIEALLTPLIAPLLFPIFRWFDKITDREQTSEISAQVS